MDFGLQGKDLEESPRVSDSSSDFEEKEYSGDDFGEPQGTPPPQVTEYPPWEDSSFSGDEGLMAAGQKKMISGSPEMRSRMISEKKMMTIWMSTGKWACP